MNECILQTLVNAKSNATRHYNDEGGHSTGDQRYFTARLLFIWCCVRWRWLCSHTEQSWLLMLLTQKCGEGSTKTVWCPSVHLSVCSIYRPLQQHVVGLLLRAGDMEWLVHGASADDGVLHIGSGIGHSPRANNPAEVVTFFNHNFVNCNATLILAIKNLQNKRQYKPKWCA